MKSESPIPYIWETSIPQSWVRLKGRDHFKPAEALSPPPNPIDFLRRTQQCVTANLQPPLSHSPQLSRPRNSERSQSDFGTQKRTAQLREIEIEGVGTGTAEMRASLPAPKKIKLRFSSTVKLELRSHIMSKIASPRLFAGERNQAPRMSPSNHAVQQFLQRFETTQKQQRPKTSRKGFLPMKLSVSMPRLLPKPRPQADIFLRLS